MDRGSDAKTDDDAARDLEPLTLAEVLDLFSRGQGGEGPAVLAECRARLSALDDDRQPHEVLWALIIVNAVHSMSDTLDDPDDSVNRMATIARNSGSELWLAMAMVVTASDLIRRQAMTPAYIEMSRAAVLLESQIDERGEPRDPDIVEGRDGTYLLGSTIVTAALVLTNLGLREHAIAWYERVIDLVARRPSARGLFSATFNTGWLFLDAGVAANLLQRSESAQRHYRRAAQDFRAAGRIPGTHLDRLRDGARLLELAAGALAHDHQDRDEIASLLGDRTAISESHRQVGRLALAALQRRRGDPRAALAVLTDVGDERARLRAHRYDALSALTIAERVRIAEDLGDTETAATQLKNLSALLLEAQEQDLRGRRTHYDRALADARAQRLSASASEQLMVDELTGLGNRRLLDRWLDTGEILPSGTAWAAGATPDPLDVLASPSDELLTVAFLDLDAFKEVNDSASHVVGDIALQQLAEQLRARTTAADLVVRFGGDEFVVVMPGRSLAAARAVVDQVAEQFAERTAQHFRIGRPLSFSAGFAEQTAATPRSALLLAADQDMLAVKRARRESALAR